MFRYIVTAIIYLTAMSAIDEDLIPDALSPLGTVAAYTYFTGILVAVLFGFLFRRAGTTHFSQVDLQPRYIIAIKMKEPWQHFAILEAD